MRRPKPSQKSLTFGGHFIYNVTDVLFNVNARGSLVGGNGVTVDSVGSITGVASGVELGTSVAAGVGTVGVGTCVGVVVGATVGVTVGIGCSSEPVKKSL